MKKPLFSAIYFLSLATAGLTIHQAFAERAPAVEPMTEVSIEENRSTKTHNGFDFAAKSEATISDEAKRIPANITTKNQEHPSPYSYIGPMIFLLALPIALWIVVAKKMKSTDKTDNIGYYPKTFQFKSPKSNFHDEDDDDQSYPKAS